MIDIVAHLPRMQHDARRPQRTVCLISLESGGNVVGRCRTFHRQDDRILHRHACALRQILHRGMRRVPQQGDIRIDPVRYRIAVAQHPFLPVLADADDLLSLGMDMFETLHHLFMADRRPGDRFRRMIIVGHDQVERFPAEQRIMHDMAFRPRPNATNCTEVSSYSAISSLKMADDICWARRIR